MNETSKFLLVMGCIIVVVGTFFYMILHDVNIRNQHEVNEILEDIDSTSCDELNEHHRVEFWYYEQQGKFFPASQQIYDHIELRLLKCEVSGQ